MNYIDLFGNTFDKRVDEYLNYWKIKGYPNYNCIDYNKKKELNNLINFDENNIYKNKTLKQTMHSCGFLWSYFPHWIDVKYGNQKTIRELWNDDKKLRELIEKTLKYEIKFGNGNITINRLRQNSKVYLSKQSVSNFRPSVAKWIYNNYGNDGVVFDMSCGWGGRLFGFFASNCKTYVGCEPSKKTYNGLVQIKKDFNLKNVILINEPSECYVPEKDSLDLCFTSPPYYDTEKYCNESTQSFVKFPSKDLWINGYLKKTIQNCYIGLKKNKYMILNIANTKQHNWIESETIKISISVGFELVKELKMELSSINGKGVKYEPIYVFKKK